MSIELKFNESLKQYKRISYVKAEDDSNYEIVLDCSLGINPFGYSDKVKEFEQNSKFDANPYPAYPYNELKNAIASYWNVDSKCIRVYGGGSVVALDTVTRVFVSSGKKVLGFMPQFTEFAAGVLPFGGEYITPRLSEKDNCRFTAEVLCDNMTEEYALAYIDNPNNPTGQVIPLAEIEKVLAKAQALGVAVIVDEAYGDFITKEESAMGLLGKYTNLIVIRSFSKGYGLAGLRVGYVVCSEEIISYCDKISAPFTVTPNAAAVCEEALKYEDFLTYTREKMVTLKQKFIDSVKGFTCLETDMRVPILAMVDAQGRDLYTLLRKHGINTEAGPDVGLEKNAVRLRIPEDVDKLIEILGGITNLA
jgi:Histidinol-phosphate/aromatic aminotransferase and cobyric acid decarboxylase